MQETITLKHTRYFDEEGKPTCALNFPSGEVCEFYRAERFGTHETCVFAPRNGKDPELLKRYQIDKNDDIKVGLLIPGNWCPLFKDYEKEGEK